MKKWIITCNPKYYDVVGAFNAFESINWKQSVNIQVDDVVYIYVGKPISAIIYETKALKVNIPAPSIDDTDFVIDGSNYENYGRYMELKFIRCFDKKLLSFHILKENGLKSVQGPSKVTNDLENFILRRTSTSINKDKYLIESHLDQILLNETREMIQVSLTEEVEYNPEPKKKPLAQVSSGNNVYPRDRKTAVNALARAKHKCEVDEKHPSFTRKNTNLEYTEPHHLIPMSYQDSFESSLDVEANIVALCSNCHNQIHYGAGSEELIEELYNKREEELEQAGIPISLEDLLNLY